MLKSTSTSYKNLRNRARGKFVEEQALKFFIKNNLNVRFRNHRIWGVEHDFIVSNVWGELIFVEVKSLAHPSDLEWRVKDRQKQRLLRSAAAFMENCAAKSLGVWLLAIEERGKCHFFPLSA